MKRRNFFATLLAPIASKYAPTPTPPPPLEYNMGGNLFKDRPDYLAFSTCITLPYGPAVEWDRKKEAR